MKRRHFIRHTVLGTLGATLVHPALAGRQNPETNTASGTGNNQRGPSLMKGQPDNLRITPADSDVLSFITSFSDRALFVGGCVAGKSGQANFRSTHLLARISDLSAYQTFLTQRNAINGDGMSIGNSVCFNYQQTTFELEALLPDDFSARLNGIQSGLYANGSSMVYAHQALTFEPANWAISDSFKAFAGSIGQLKRIRTPNGYGELAQGNLGIPAYHLLSSSQDQADLNTALNQTAADPQGVMASFLQNLSLNSQVNSATAIQTLCGTRLLRSASQALLGCDSSRVAGNFARLRAAFSLQTTCGTIWHAMFQAAEVPPDGQPKAAMLALSGGCKFETFLTMQELQKTGLVKSSPSFKMYA